MSVSPSDGLLSAPRPILVIGLTARTGTNYLARLLATHRDCTRPNSLYEDYMVFGLRDLDNLVERASRHWKASSVDEKAKQLRALLGGAITTFLLEDARRESKRPVFKTPSVWGIAHAHDFLPACDIVVLTRNGPDVVESGMRSFGWKFEEASRFWGNSARYLINACKHRHRNHIAPLTVVKYEDLIADTTPTLRTILDAVGLSADGIDFDAVSEFPVYGSSIERGGSESVNWDSVTKTRDFDPLKRSEHWSQDAFRRFDWLTGGLSKDLGYELPFVFDNNKARMWSYILRDQKKHVPLRWRERFRYSP